MNSIHIPRAFVARILLLGMLTAPVFAQQPAAPVATGGEAGRLVERANVALAENQLEDAKSLLQQAVQLDPANDQARKQLEQLKSFSTAETVTTAVPAAAAPVAAPAGTVEAAPVDENGLPIDPEDLAAPTAAGGKGGAAPATESLPLDRESLARLRAAQLGKPEFRGAWITRMEWARPSADESRQRITKVLDRAVELNMNAVFFQVRGDCTTLYPSTLEPTSRLLGGGPLDWDPLKFAVDEAHKRGIQLHAYFNISTASDERNGPSDPNHVFNKNGRADANPNWLVYENGKPKPFAEYWWLNTNLPEVQTHVRRAALDLVQRYDIDGLHYDRVRFPSSGASDDPWSKARFAATNPQGLDYNAWQRENLAHLLTDIYGACVTLRPKLMVSAAVWGIYDKTKLPQGGKSSGYSWASSGLQDYHQDSVDWLNRGCVDALVPMIYWNMGADKPDYDELMHHFVQDAAASGRFIIGGQRVFGPVEMLRQAVATGLVGGAGHCPFTLNRIYDKGCDALYKTSIYPDKVPVPEMAWRTKPQRGIILLVVVDAAGRPVMDAQVRMAGSNTVRFSSADGFCAIVDAPLSTPVTLAAEKAGSGKPAATTTVTVEPGKSSVVRLAIN